MTKVKQKMKQFYTKEHLTIIQEEDGRTIVAITPYGIEQIGEINFIDWDSNNNILIVESTKNVFEVEVPIEGEGFFNYSDEAIEEGWLIEYSYAEILLDKVMTEEEYKEYCK